MTAVLVQTTSADRLQSIQQYLNREGSGWGALLAALGLVALILVIVLAYTLQQRARRGDVHRPRKLFRRMLRRLELAIPQRDLLQRMAADLGLENPTTLLLARSIFEKHAGDWLNAGRSAGLEDRGRIAELTGILFPSGQGTLKSTTTGQPSTSATSD